MLHFVSSPMTEKLFTNIKRDFYLLFLHYYGFPEILPDQLDLEFRMEWWVFLPASSNNFQLIFILTNSNQIKRILLSDQQLFCLTFFLLNQWVKVHRTARRISVKVGIRKILTNHFSAFLKINLKIYEHIQDSLQLHYQNDFVDEIEP